MVGAVAFWLLAFIVTTSILWQERRAISRRLWKRTHFATYAMFPLYAVHAIFTDPALKDRPIDPFDGEKVFIEVCILVVALAVVWRVRHQLRQPPARAHRPKTRRASQPRSRHQSDSGDPGAGRVGWG